MPSTLTTPRLVLRPRTLADTDACMAMDNEPSVTRFVSGPWSDPAAHRAYIEARTRGPYRGGLGYWTLEPRERVGEFLGWVLLIPLDATGPEIEIGWRLRPAFWGAGYATEAARALLRHAFSDLGLEAVVAEVDAANLASIAVAEKIGLRHRGSRASAGGNWLRFAVTRTEAARTPAS